MTKERDALSFDDAIMKIGLELSWDQAGRAVLRTPKQVRNWSDPDKGAPDIVQALALDVAFVRAGNGKPPILSSYIHQFEQETGVAVCPVPLGDLTLRMVRETAEGIAAVMEASGPSCTREKDLAALKELDDVADVVAALRRQIAARLAEPPTP